MKTIIALGSLLLLSACSGALTAQGQWQGLITKGDFQYASEAAVKAGAQK